MRDDFVAKNAASDPIDEAAIDWFVRRRDGLDEAEAIEFASWIELPEHRSRYANVEAMWGAMDAIPEPMPVPVSEAQWNDRRWLPRRTIAAALILFVTVSLTLTFRDYIAADARTDRGEVRTMKLSDGSIASLDAASALEIRIDANERRVRLLHGAAWFQVAHEARPFLVEVAGAQVRDIGTAFEVDKLSEGGSVAVSQGTVELTTANGPALRLDVGQAARFKFGGEARRNVPPPSVAAWREGRLQFVDAAVEDVLSDLERHGAGTIVWLPQRVAARRISGSIALSDPTRALDAVLARADARARRLGPFLWIETRAS